jgi:hypothetical protein
MTTAHPKPPQDHHPKTPKNKTPPPPLPKNTQKQKIKPHTTTPNSPIYFFSNSPVK